MPETEAYGRENEPTTYNILFVCSGNTCRSPMAMAAARRALEKRGWSNVAVRSAGTLVGTPGGHAAEHAIRILAEQGLDLSEHKAQPLTPELVAWADLILAMSPSHLWAVAEMGGAERVALITEFLEQETSEGIPDPFGSDEETYRRTLARLEEAVEGVLRRLAPILAP